MNERTVSTLRRWAVGVVGVAWIATAAAACTAATGDAEEDLSDVPAGETETFTRTIVRLADDGSETISVELVTREEQLQAIGARALRDRGEYEGLGTAADEISKDASCQGASIWIFDEVNLAGNEICFIGSGRVYLDDYCRTAGCTDRWGQNVRSYYSGVDPGLFSYDGWFTCDGGQLTCQPFGTFDLVGTASGCEQHARYLGLDLVCVPA